ncbi:MAG: gluconate 2-dehydrogenase subunit 3 family protein [Myxococcota bacterium]
MTAATNPMSRRRLLRVGGVVGAALAGGTWLVMRGGGDEHYRGLCPGAQPKVLSVKELGVLAAFCDRVCPAPSQSQPGPRVVRVAERIDKELSFHHAKMQSDVKAALLVLEHGGWLHLSATRFTRLPAEAQDSYLARMGVTGNEVERQVFASLKLLALFFYYVDERTWKAMHYDGPFAAKKAPPADSSLAGGAHG